VGIYGTNLLGVFVKVNLAVCVVIAIDNVRDHSLRTATVHTEVIGVTVYVKKQLMTSARHVYVFIETLQKLFWSG
jgi:hypothetical protein